MSITAFTGSDDSSPFDRLRRFDENGIEYWDARELRAAFGYDKWERFEGVVKKAIDAMRATGQDAEAHVSRTRETCTTAHGAAHERGNYRLTRFGAYVVAMNGDPKKPEIAAAQIYFAVSTRENEIRKESIERPQLSNRELALMVLAEADRADLAEAKVQELSPKAERHDAFLAAGVNRTLTAVAKELRMKPKAFVLALKEKMVLYHKTNMYGDTYLLPYQQHMDAGRFDLVDVEVGTIRKRFKPQVYVTPLGVAFLFSLFAGSEAA